MRLSGFVLLACSVLLAVPLAFGAQYVPESAETRRVYGEYLRAEVEAREATACLQKPQCLNTEDVVIRATSRAQAALNRLIALADEGDTLAGLLYGMNAYERAQTFANTAEQVRDPQFRESAVLLRMRAREQYALAQRGLAAPAAAGHPDACMTLGEILHAGLAGARDPERAFALFRCAAIGYLDTRQRKLAVDAYNRMGIIYGPNYVGLTEVYARIFPSEPARPWAPLAPRAGKGG